MGQLSNILIVDDDKSICKMIANLLELEGYPHRVVMGGEEALKAIQGEKFQIVISEGLLKDTSFCCENIEGCDEKKKNKTIFFPEK